MFLKLNASKHLSFSLLPMEVYALQNYSVLSTLGSGGFAKVFFAIHNPTGVRVAIKQIPKIQFNEEDNYDARIRKEIDIMSKTNHPFICSLFDYIETKEFYYIIIEYCQNGSLLSLINKNGVVKESDAVKIFTELILAVKHLHEDCKIAHRDIKAENILFDCNNNIKLIDFGLSSSVNDTKFMKTRCGSPSYASPEVITGKSYNFMCDIWSCGVVLYAMVTGNLPFKDDNFSRLAQKIVYAEVEYPTNLSPMLVDLLSKLLIKDFNKRITISEILEHPWVNAKYQEISKFINDIKYEEKTVYNALEILGIKSEDVKAEFDQGSRGVGITSFNIMRRDILNENLKDLNEEFQQRSKLNRRLSENDAQLPGIAYPKNILSINLHTLPLKTKMSLRRKIPSTLIHHH